MKINQSHLTRLTSLNVSLVYLFGSFAEGKNSPLSDIDIGIVFTDNHFPATDSSGIYNELYFIFTDVFTGKSIDIVFLENAGLELKFDVVKHGKNIFCISETEKYRFEDDVTMMYMDFKPILNEFNQAILQRF